MTRDRSAGVDATFDTIRTMPAAEEVDRTLLESIKLSCLSTGIRVTDQAFSLISNGGTELLTIHEYPTTGGLTFVLPGDVWVNAPFDEWYCADASVELDAIDGRLVVHNQEGDVPVIRFVPLPGYLDNVDELGRPFTDVAMSHGDRVRVSPFAGCAFDCSFCDIPAAKYQARPDEQLLSALRAAQADERLPVRHVLISGGSPRRAHYQLFEDTCRFIVENAGMPVDVMLSPMLDNLDFIHHLAAAGVEGLAINIELFSASAGEMHLGRKFRTTRGSFDEFVTRAVDLLGRTGRVRSLIIPGLEPVAETLRGVEYLASLGCEPTLSPFRPADGTALSALPPVPVASLRTLLDESRSIVAEFGMGLGPKCVPCQHNTLTLPWDRLGA